jgi:prepilin-type N-terminal cleavage/methylation domain-containing protein
MKKQRSRAKIRKPHQGFTLVETVIAMGIITIMITAFMAAFGPAVKGITKSISAKEANRLATTLEYELSVLSPEELDTVAGGGLDGKYTTAFEKAFEWIKASGSTNKSDMVLMYQYKGDPTSPQADGSLSPYTGSAGVPGKDYVLQSVVRQFSNTSVIKGELETPGVVEGRIFLVRMSQLIFDGSGALVVTSDRSNILDPHIPNDPKDYTSTTDPTKVYPEATIAFQASFYVFKSSSYNYINNAFELTPVDSDGNPKATGKPIFVRNMAVRR